MLERLLWAAVTLLAIAWCVQQAWQWVEPLLLPLLLVGGATSIGVAAWRRRYW